MAIAAGDRLKVHYTGKLANGEEFDSSRDRDPLEFVVGDGSLLPGFENAVLGKRAGDKVCASIPAEEAYGAVDPELIFSVERKLMPDHIPLVEGTPIQLSNEQGQMDVVISHVDADNVTLDANHPLAGKDLLFEIEIMDVKPAR